MPKTIVIEVIDVSEPSFVKTAKGGYNIIEVAYKEEGKVKGKKLVDFANQEIFAAAQALQPKDVATIVIDKEEGSDGKEYWQWKSVTAGGELPVGTAPAQSASAGAVGSAKPAGRVTGSNYETAEERANRQLLIVRQSQVTNALKFFEQTQADIKREDVIELAEYFKEYVFTGLPAKKETISAASTAAKKQVAKKSSISDMEDDIPF